MRGQTLGPRAHGHRCLVLACGLALGCAPSDVDVATRADLPARSVASLSGEVRAAAEAPFSFEGPLTLERAVEISLERNHALAIVRQEREIADGQITVARSTALPTVGLRGTYMHMHEVSTFGGSPSYNLPVYDMGGTQTGYTTMPGTPEMELGALDNYAAALTLQQPLYLGGRSLAAQRAACAHRRGVEHQLDGAAQGLVLAVHKGFYDLLLADEDVKAVEEALSLARRHLEDVKRRLDQGVATRFEVTRAEVRVAMSEASAIGARNGVALARTSLFTLLGMALDAPVTIEGSLEFAPRAAAGDDDVLTALRQRPDLAAHDETIAMQRENIRITHADGLPSVLLTGEAGWEDPSQRSFGSLEADTYWRAGVVLNLTLFDGLRLGGRLRQERARLAQLASGRAQLVDQIRLEVRQSHLSVESARELVASQAKALEQARDALQLAQAGYEEGVGTQLDVLDAQLGLTEARRGYARAVYGHVMASVALQRAMGTILTIAGKGDVR
jgi:outer membrane protein